MATRTARPATRGERVIAFIETYCRVPDGKLVGRPIELDKFQRKFILDVYDNPHGTRRGLLSIARKNGKTALIAAMLLAHIAGPEARLNSDIVSGAMSRDQASIVYNLAAKMIGLNETLGRVCRCVPSLKTIVGLRKNVTYKALSAEGKTKHGMSPVVVILDETGQVRGPKSDFVDALITAQGAHDDPLLLVISTQAPNDNDLLSIWLDDALTGEDKTTVCHLYTAPIDLDISLESTWRLANPALGKFRSLQDVKDQSARAIRMPSAEATFRNLTLNQRVETTSPFVSRGVWVLNNRAPDLEVFKRCPVYGGLDLSAKLDLTSLILTARDENDEVHVLSYFWTPQDTLADRAKRDRAPYDVWAAEGYIKPVDGVSLEYSVIAEDMRDILKDMPDVRLIGFDRWRIEQLKKEIASIEDFEPPLLPFGQGFKDMAPALDATEELLVNEKLRHGGNPVLTMCVANTRVEKDAAGNRKLNKAKSTGRIDGAVGLVIALGVEAAQTEPTKSFWEQTS